MVLPFESIRGFAQPYVYAWSLQGLGANEIQRKLIASGLGYSRKTLLSDIRSYKGLERLRDPIKSLRWDVLIPEWAETEVALNLKRRYRFDFEVTLKNTETGAISKIDISLSSSSVRTKGVIQDKIEELLRKQGELYKNEIVAVVLHQVLRRAGTGRTISPDDASWD